MNMAIEKAKEYGVAKIVVGLPVNMNGTYGPRAEHAKEFADALEKALAVDGPVVIDTYIDKDEFVLPMLPPGGSIDDIIVSKERGE